jgi:ATP-dependent exoDNAse (exonuclease V) beta subunit
MDLRALLGLVDAGTEAVDPRIRGTVVHAWMEEVGWIEDGLPDADTRGRILGREAPELAGDRRRDFLREWGGIVETAAEREEVRTALSRARAGEVHPGAELVVERELPFLLREEDALVEGIIDRLVLVRRGGRLVAAEVVDYKTDRIAPGDDEALGESVAVYAPQLRAYRRAVAHLYGIVPDAVRLRLVYLVPGVVRDVDGA